MRDLQQRIVAIVNDESDYVAGYAYDSFGLTTELLGNVQIARINPFRYKGYYYDTETGFYYCKTRYYNPYWGRWLNPCEALKTGLNSLNNTNRPTTNIGLGDNIQSFNADSLPHGQLVPSSGDNNVGESTNPVDDVILSRLKTLYVVMTHHTTMLLDMGNLGSVSYTITESSGNGGILYFFDDVGNDSIGSGFGYNFGNAYGVSYYFTSNSVGETIQLTPWLTLGAEISPKGITISGGATKGGTAVTGNITIGWGAIGIKELATAGLGTLVSIPFVISANRGGGNMLWKMNYISAYYH